MFGTDVVAELAKEDGGAIGAAIREAAADDLVTVAVGPTGQVNAEARGPEGFLAVWRDWTASFDRFELDPVEEPIVRGNAMVTTVRQRGQIADSNAEVPAEGAAVAFVGDAGLVRMELHLSLERALRAAGIEPTDAGGTLPT
jgi:hypothetical protein